MAPIPTETKKVNGCSKPGGWAPGALTTHLNQNSGCMEVGNGLKRGRRELLGAMKMVYILIDVWITQMYAFVRTHGPVVLKIHILQFVNDLSIQIY